MSTASVKSSERTLRLLEIVAAHPEGIAFAALETESDFPKSSLHGLLRTLVDLRWLILDPESRRYSVGIRAWEVGSAFRPSRDLLVTARPLLLAANRLLGETIHLAVLDADDVVYLDRVEGSGMLRLVSDIGARLPAYATGIGKAMLAALSHEDRHRRFAGAHLQRFTSRTETSGDRLLETLEQARAAGFAEDEGEYTLGVSCVAAPILSVDGTPIAALSCSAPTARIEGGEISRDEMRSVVLQHAAEISRALSPTEGSTIT